MGMALRAVTGPAGYCGSAGYVGQDQCSGPSRGCATVCGVASALCGEDRQTCLARCNAIRKEDSRRIVCMGENLAAIANLDSQGADIRGRCGEGLWQMSSDCLNPH